MSDKWEKVTSAALSCSAIVLALVLVHQEFFRKPTQHQGAPASQYVANWRDALHAGHALGDTTAPIKLIEFADLECPFCRSFNQRLPEVLSAFPRQVQYEFVHYPLSIHRFARPAARALECSLDGTNFERAIDSFYAKQDSFGLKSWASFATDAGVHDTASFQACVSRTAPLPMIESGEAIGKRVGVAGTPTILLNGWRYGAPPSDTELVRAIRDLLAGKQPYSGFPMRGHVAVR